MYLLICLFIWQTNYNLLYLGMTSFGNNLNSCISSNLSLLVHTTGCDLLSLRPLDHVCNISGLSGCTFWVCRSLWFQMTMVSHVI